MFKKIMVPVVIILILAGSLGSTYYFYTKYQTASRMLKDPSAASAAEVKNVTTKLSRLMQLPEGEDPTVATVLDKDKIKDQPFFAKAENGDKVVIYTKAGKAILYRMSENKIIDVAPINLGQSQGTIVVAVANGTPKPGTAKVFSDALKATASNVTIAAQITAKSNDYAKSIVVDITGQKPDLAKQMAELIGGEVAALPEGEVIPTPDNPEDKIDLYVIVGANFKPTSEAPVPTPAPTTEAAPTPAQ